MYMQCSSLYASKTTHVYVYKSSSVNAMHVTILNKYISKGLELSFSNLFM